MKRLMYLVSTLIIIGLVTPAVAQDKSNTKSTLTEGYKQLLTDAVAALQLGNIDVDKYAAEKIDSLLRECFLQDAENIFANVAANISEGKIQRPKLVFEKVDGKSLFKRSTMKAYIKGFQRFVKTLPMSVKTSDYDTFVKTNKMLVSKPKSKLIKEFKNHLYGKFLNVKG